MAPLKKLSNPPTSQIDTRYDEVTDVLCAWLTGVPASHCGPATVDMHLLLERDEHLQIVGLQILGASTLVPSFWKSHPDRVEIPVVLLQFVDNWLAEAWAEPTKLP